MSNRTDRTSLSPMPFMDDGSSCEEERSMAEDKSSCNFRITRCNDSRNYDVSNESANVSITNGIQVSPSSSNSKKNGESVGEIVLREGTLVHKHKDFQMTLRAQEEGEQGGAGGLRLVIKGQKSIISIESLDHQSSIIVGGDDEEEEMYEYLNDEVGKVFKAPDRRELEKAVMNVKQMNGKQPKLVCRIVKSDKKPKQSSKQRKGNWKVLSRSFLSMRGMRHKDDRPDSDERYPKIVLLSNPRPPTPRKSATPDQKSKFRKLAVKSKSLNYIPSQELKKAKNALNECSIEQHIIDIEKSNLDKEKTHLEDEQKAIKIEKKVLEKEKKVLKKSQSFLKQEQSKLDGKKNIIRDERSLLNAKPRKKKTGKEQNILGEEKLCIEIEKQLLDEEKQMLAEERSILNKEKSMMVKERSVLGAERNVLQEEKNLIVKEKSVLEKQRNLLEEHGLGSEETDDERTGDSEPNGSEESSEKESEVEAPRKIIRQDTFENYHARKRKKRNTPDQVLEEIEDIFEETLDMYPDARRPPRQVSRPMTMEDMSPGHHCHDSCYYPGPYSLPSVYVPVYNLPQPYCRTRPTHQCECHKKTAETQTIDPPSQKPATPVSPKPTTSNSVATIATEQPSVPNEETNPEDDLSLSNLPFGLLSSFFPRVVIMKSFPEETEEEDTLPTIVEMPKDRSDPYPDLLNPEDSGRPYRMFPGDTLSVPNMDLRIKAPAVRPKVDVESEGEGSETDESGINTGGTSDKALSLKELICKQKDEEKMALECWEGDSEESGSVENLLYGEGDTYGDDSGRAGREWQLEDTKQVKEIENGKRQSTNLPLTELGHSIYDKLSKLSVERETDASKRVVAAAGAPEPRQLQPSDTKYNVKLEMENRVVQVSVPDDRLNFDIFQAGTKQMSIGVSSKEEEDVVKRVIRKDEEAKAVVRRAELWHGESAAPQPVGKDVRIVLGVPAQQQQQQQQQQAADTPQEITLSVDKKQMVFSVGEGVSQTRAKCACGRDDKRTVSTDDNVNQARATASACPRSNRQGQLSPRTNQLLATLRQKLEAVESAQAAAVTADRILPGVFLVKHMSCSPRTTTRPVPARTQTWTQTPRAGPKPTTTTTATAAATAGCKLREYYCEECLATMRMFEDENLTVKEIVDKFETMIRLGMY